MHENQPEDVLSSHEDALRGAFSPTPAQRLLMLREKLVAAAQETNDPIAEKLFSGRGEPYYHFDSAMITDIDARSVRNLKAFNRSEEPTTQRELLREIFPNLTDRSFERFVVDRYFEGVGLYMVQMGEKVRAHPNNFWIAQGGVTIGDHVTFGEGVTMTSMAHPLHPDQRKIQRAAPIVIGSNVFIGADTAIVNPVKVRDGFAEPLTIGDNVVILPDSLINRDIPSGVVVGGTPARVLGTTSSWLVTHGADMDQLLTSTRLHYPPRSPLTVEQQLVIEMNDARSDEEILALKERIFTAMNRDENARFTITYGFQGEDLDRVRIGAGTFVNKFNVWNAAGGIEIGAHADFAFGAKLLTDEGSGPIVIGPRVWLGSGAVVDNRGNKGTLEVGEGSILGAKSRVLHSVPPRSIVLGDPGKVARTLTEADRIPDLPPEWMDPEYFITRISELMTRMNADR